jgi:hypothetical protein
MSDWWAKRLNVQPQPDQATTNYQPPQQQRPIYQPQQPQAPTTIMEGVAAWQGGEGKAEVGNCPQCGSDLYFSRRNAGSTYGPGGMATTAPRCFACGFTQGRMAQGQPR